MLLMHRLMVALGIMAVLVKVTTTDPLFSPAGYLDSDVWTDLDGNFYSNDELDLSLNVKFHDAVSATVCATVLGGSIPAGYGRPGGVDVTRYELFADTFEIAQRYSRWAGIAFDGVSLTWKTPAATFTVGDLVYKYGAFNYYFYKRKAMIAPESFTRGIGASFGGGRLSQDLAFGSADIDGAGDVYGATKLSANEAHTVALYYGARGDVRTSFEKSGRVFAGLEYVGTLGSSLTVKLDAGYRNIAGDTRANAIALLAEPSLSLGKFTTAAAVYGFVGPDVAGANTVGDEFFAYVEPGYSFSDVISVGLPLEVHTPDVHAFAETGQFWAVPTLYLYPAPGVQWWIWGQFIAPLSGNGRPAYGLGSEIIVSWPSSD